MFRERKPARVVLSSGEQYDFGSFAVPRPHIGVALEAAPQFYSPVKYELMK